MIHTVVFVVVEVQGYFPFIINADERQTICKETVSIYFKNFNVNQAEAELCQARFKLGLAKPAIC